MGWEVAGGGEDAWGPPARALSPRLSARRPLLPRFLRAIAPPTPPARTRAAPLSLSQQQKKKGKRRRTRKGHAQNVFEEPAERVEHGVARPGRRHQFLHRRRPGGVVGGAGDGEEEVRGGRHGWGGEGGRGVGGTGEPRPFPLEKSRVFFSFLASRAAALPSDTLLFNAPRPPVPLSLAPQASDPSPPSTRAGLPIPSHPCVGAPQEKTRGH